MTVGQKIVRLCKIILLYSYYDFKYVNNSIFTNDTTVHLDTIVDYIKSHKYPVESDNDLITEGDPLSGIDTATVGIKNDSLLYFKTDGGHITFTALTVDGDWTNGQPATLKYKEKDVWYYIDATDTTKAFFTLTEVLIGLFHYDRTEHFDPVHNHIERYIYNENDDWRPLYIRAVLSTPAKPYEYATEEWLNKKDFDLVAATQHIFGVEGDLAISREATASAENAAQFKFELAATIGEDSLINNNKIKVGVGDKDTTFAGGGIELFYMIVPVSDGQGGVHVVKVVVK